MKCSCHTYKLMSRDEHNWMPTIVNNSKWNEMRKGCTLPFIVAGSYFLLIKLLYTPCSTFLPCSYNTDINENVITALFLLQLFGHQLVPKLYCILHFISPRLSVGLHVIGGGHVIWPYVVLPLLEAQHPAEDAAGVDANAHVQLHVSGLNHGTGKEKREDWESRNLGF